MFSRASSSFFKLFNVAELSTPLSIVCFNLTQSFYNFEILDKVSVGKNLFGSTPFKDFI